MEGFETGSFGLKVYEPNAKEDKFQAKAPVSGPGSIQFVTPAAQFSGSAASSESSNCHRRASHT